MKGRWRELLRITKVERRIKWILVDKEIQGCIHSNFPQTWKGEVRSYSRNVLLFPFFFFWRIQEKKRINSKGLDMPMLKK